MKPFQMVALLVAVVLIIFVATFARQYLGQKPAAAVAQPGRDAASALHFPDTVWPPEGADAGLGPEFERNAPGSHDYWFENTSDKPVLLHLSRKNCTCSNVGVALAPAGHPGPEAPPDPSLAFQELMADSTSGGGQPVEIPGKAKGWVRLGWKSQKLGPERLLAEVYASVPGSPSQVSTRLEARVYLAEPVMVAPDTKELQLEPLGPGSPTREGAFVLFSVTRPELKLAAEPAEQQAAKHPFLTVGAPVPLGDAERAKLAAEQKLNVKCAYRLPVTVRERAADGTQAAIGPFRMGFTVSSEEMPAPVDLAVLGAVRGEVSVVSDSDVKDRILLGSFPARFGITKTVTLEADPGVELALDQVHPLPDFMEVKGPTREGPAGDRQAWALTVTIKPNGVNGTFPNKDDARLRDTAIYLTTKGVPPRRVRIPVGGNASQR